ncbi:hypothetical protein HPG69_009812 [Diceros bicornis minor]|uniref:Uncharacterized protein n=1 Tax=Diceros bicornis minor TaxID=77932 RepID=A0A7J7EVU5_DICBM|nr:hypothetical protein HPG69_009812 [Diceros bicornis minor]
MQMAGRQDSELARERVEVRAKQEREKAKQPSTHPHRHYDFLSPVFSDVLSFPSTHCPESKSFIEDATEYFLNTVSSEVLQLLLTNEKARETLVVVADLSRDEADALCKALKKLNMAMEDKDVIQKDQLDREKI